MYFRTTVGRLDVCCCEHSVLVSTGTCIQQLSKLCRQYHDKLSEQMLLPCVINLKFDSIDVNIRPILYTRCHLPSIFWRGDLKPKFTSSKLNGFYYIVSFTSGQLNLRMLMENRR